MIIRIYIKEKEKRLKLFNMSEDLFLSFKQKIETEGK